MDAVLLQEHDVVFRVSLFVILQKSPPPPAKKMEIRTGPTTIQIVVPLLSSLAIKKDVNMCSVVYECHIEKYMVPPCASKLGEQQQEAHQPPG
jgi:hypothetical protein